MGERTRQVRGDVSCGLHESDKVALSHRKPARSSVSRVWRWVLLLALLVAGVATATTYVYDSNGRLTAVTNSAGVSGRYVYDALGNLVRIDNVPAGQLAIFAFSPNHGSPGTTVKIAGQGFSTTLANDAVSFNGTAATVTAATASQVTATVPSGAATGPVSVTVAGTTATSTTSFVIDGAGTGLPPTINSGGVTPLIGSIGTMVTINGANLYPVPYQTTPAINGMSGVPKTFSNSQVTFPVPPNAGSGKVAITTPFGSAQSTQDFYVTPPGVAVANVTTQKRITVGSNTSLTIAPGKYAAILFTATAGNWLSIQASGFTPSNASGTYTIYDTFNHPILTGAISASEPSIHLPVIPVTGSYSIWIQTDTLSPSMKVTASLAVDPTLAATGVGTAASTQLVGQTARLLFNAVAGNNPRLAITGITSNPTDGGWVYVDVYDPNNVFVRELSCYSTSSECAVALPNVALSGTYQAIVNPYQFTMSFTMTLSQDVAAVLVPGQPQELDLTVTGQEGIASFTGTAAGQQVVLQVVSQTTTPTGNDVSYTIYGPDGTELSAFDSTGPMLQPLTLPSAGTYTIYIDPANSALAALQLEFIPDATGTLTNDGTSHAFATTSPGQSLQLSFSALAGDNLGMALTGLVTNAGATNGVQVTIYDPNQVYVTSVYCYTSNPGCSINLPALAVSGNYQVIVVPDQEYGPETVSFTMTLSHDVTGTLQLNQPAQTFNLSALGQDGIASFSGNAGDLVTVEVVGLTTSFGNQGAAYTVHAPDGTWLANTGMGVVPNAVNLLPLPATGIYTVAIDPSFGASATTQIELVPGVSGALPTNGIAQTYRDNLPGQSVQLSFTGTAGDPPGIAIGSVAVSPATYGQIRIDLYAPSGSLDTEYWCTVPSANCGYMNQQLSSSGLYQMVVTPVTSPPSTMSFQAN